MTNTMNSLRGNVSTHKPPIILDIEASGIGRGSYPIEVGFVLADGSSECRLIRPEPDWQSWDNAAQLLHGIERETLQKHGYSARNVALFLNEHLHGRTVYSDAWGQDNSWLALLFHAAGCFPRFRLESIRALISEKQLLFWNQARQQVLQEVQLRRHRASADARIIQQTYQLSMFLAEQAKPSS